MLNQKLATTISTLKSKFLDGWIISLGLSGKDSFAVAHCAIEALKLAREERSDAGPLYINTVDTTIDNFEVMNFIRQCHNEINLYAAEQQLRPSYFSRLLINAQWCNTLAAGSFCVPLRIKRMPVSVPLTGKLTA